MYNAIKAITSASLFVLLVACGGGGGGNEPDATEGTIDKGSSGNTPGSSGGAPSSPDSGSSDHGGTGADPGQVTEPPATTSPTQQEGLFLVAGNGSGSGYVDGQGTNARFDGAGGLTRDGAGNIYVASYYTPIRKITPDGRVSTLANLNSQQIAADLLGNVYAVSGSSIRKISQSGVITMPAGGEIAGDVDGTVTEARFSSHIGGIAVDNAGNIYVSDTGNASVRKITPDGIVSTVARLTASRPSHDIAVDAELNIYVSRATWYASSSSAIGGAGPSIEKISPNGVITQVASFRGATRNNQGSSIYGLEVGNDGHIYFVVDGSIGKLNADGQITWVAVDNSLPMVDENGLALPSFMAKDLTFDQAGNIYYAAGDHVGKIGLNNIRSIFAGMPTQDVNKDGTGTAASFKITSDIARDNKGNVYVRAGGAIRRIDPAGRVITLNIGVDITGSIAVDAQGVLYALHWVGVPRNMIYKITSTESQTGVAGSVSAAPISNDKGEPLVIENVQGIAVSSDGIIYLAGAHGIRKISLNREMSLLAGSTDIYTHGLVDGEGANARFLGPTAIAIGKDGNLYVTDRANYAIRKVTPTGFVTTIAGGTRGITDGVGSLASFDGPEGITIDDEGNLYVADQSASLIRKVTPSGVVTTLAGHPFWGIGYGTLGGNIRLPGGIIVVAPNTLAITGGYGVIGLRSEQIGRPLN